jgi:hypothetical protein
LKKANNKMSLWRQSFRGFFVLKYKLFAEFRSYVQTVFIASFGIQRKRGTYASQIGRERCLMSLQVTDRWITFNIACTRLQVLPSVRISTALFLSIIDPVVVLLLSPPVQVISNFSSCTSAKQAFCTQRRLSYSSD